MRFRQLILHSSSLVFVFLSDLMFFELAGFFQYLVHYAVPVCCSCCHQQTQSQPLCVRVVRAEVAERERLTSGFVPLGICRSVVPSKQETSLGTLF